MTAPSAARVCRVPELSCRPGAPGSRARLLGHWHLAGGFCVSFFFGFLSISLHHWHTDAFARREPSELSEWAHIPRRSFWNP